MFVIIEGSDCSGKTTFAQQLQDALKHSEPNSTVTYRHAGPPALHALDEYVSPFLSYRPGQDTHVICDRLHIGEVVYPHLLGRSTTQTSAVNAYIELFLRSRGALLVYCQATNDHLTDCGMHRGDARVDVARIPAVNAAFNAAVTRSMLPRLNLNVSEGATDDQLDLALELAGDEAWFAEHLNPFTTYVGRGRPTRLLFGDRRGPASTPLESLGSWPAFAPYPATSGDYLLTTLTRWDLRVPTHGTLLSTIGVANACDVDDPYALWTAVGQPSVVALGRNAATELTRARVPHRSVAHPQYRRRFQHHDHDGYLDQLLNAHSEATA